MNIQKKKKKYDPYKWFELSLQKIHIPKPEREYQFAKKLGRKWRADFAWPKDFLLLEIQGGVFVGGGHVRGRYYRKELEKQNIAELMGYTVLKYLPEQLKTIAIQQVKQFFTEGWIES